MMWRWRWLEVGYFLKVSKHNLGFILQILLRNWESEKEYSCLPLQILLAYLSFNTLNKLHNG